MDHELTPEEREYIDVYEQTAREVSIKDKGKIIEELKAEGYSTADAEKWVEVVSKHIKTNKARHGAVGFAIGALLFIFGILLWFILPGASPDGFGYHTFGMLLTVCGAILTLWGLTSWAKYSK